VGVEHPVPSTRREHLRRADRRRHVHGPRAGNDPPAGRAADAPTAQGPPMAQGDAGDGRGVAGGLVLRTMRRRVPRLAHGASGTGPPTGSPHQTSATSCSWQDWPPIPVPAAPTPPDASVCRV
jgi:hypothetical protein